MIDTNLPTLKRDDVLLIPFSRDSDFDYFYDLVMADEGDTYNRDEAKGIINQIEAKFWKVYCKGDRVGVMFYFKNAAGAVVMEGLKDMRKQTGLRFSVNAGKMFLEYLFCLYDVIFTFARIKDRGVQLLCRRLGFVETEAQNKDLKVIIYKKEREQCQQ